MFQTASVWSWINLTWIIITRWVLIVGIATFFWAWMNFARITTRKIWIL
jgi:hypothetical protein